MLKGVVGRPTFGFERHLNQRFYSSREWKQLRDHVITRDNGCDLAVDGHEIHGGILIHHLNPMSPLNIVHDDASILDPNNLITTTLITHNAIHFGDEKQLPRPLVVRERGDTQLWATDRSRA